MDKNKCTSCGEAPKKCSCKNKDFTKAVVEIDNPEHITLMRKVSIPASMGDDTTIPPEIGKYKNVLLYYEANKKSYLYSSDGIPTQLANGFTDYEDAINLPKINGVTLIGDKTLSELGLKVDFFDTVANMIAADLKNGDYVRTLGYYAAKDGGGAFYKIVEVSPDGYAETLDNGLYAELIPDGSCNVKQYGVKADGETDNSTKLNALLAAGVAKIYFPNGTYYLGSSITVPETCTYISGEEMDKTILECAGDGFIFDNPTLITVRCMLIQKKVPRHQNIGMQGAFRSSNFEYLKLQGFEKGMLVSGDSWSNLYLRCKFAYCDYGYYKDNIGETDWNDFWKCGFTDNSVCGFYLNGNNYNNNLFSCDFERNIKAIMAGYSPKNLIIDRGYFTNNSIIFSVIGGFTDGADVTIQNAWINQPELVAYTAGWLVTGRTMPANTPQSKTSAITVKGCDIFVHNTNIKPFAFDDSTTVNPMSMIVFNIYDNLYEGNSGVVPNNYPEEYFDLIDTTNYPNYLGINFRPSVKTDLMYKNLDTYLHWKIDNRGVQNGYGRASNLFHLFGYYSFTSTGEYNVYFDIDGVCGIYDTYTGGKFYGVVRYTDGTIETKAINILSDKIYIYGLDPTKTTDLISLDVWYGGDSRYN